MSFDNTQHYSPIALGEIDDKTEEWLHWREHGPHWQDPMHPDYVETAMGGSDVSKLFDCNKWESKLELFHKKAKTKNAPAQKKNQEILDNGHELEPFIAKKFVAYMAEKGVTDVEVWNDINMYQHPYYKFALGNLDRRIKVNGVPGILELKTANNWDDVKLYWENGKVPPYYEWQCRYYMEIMNLDYCYIVCMWGFTLDKMATILIRRDKEIGAYMMEKVAEFVEQCELGIEPPMQEGEYDTLSKYYLRLYGIIPAKAAPVDLVSTPEVDKVIADVQEIAEKKKAAEAYLDSVKADESRIIAKLLSFTGGKGDYLNYRLDDETVLSISLKFSHHNASLDEDKIKEEHPDLYDKYRAPGKFSASLFKAHEPELATKYGIPKRINPTKLPTFTTEYRNIPLAKAQ